MSYLNGRYCIVFNGEIYNYIGLRNELQREGYNFKSNTDTEVIMASYDCYGFDCCNKFNGMWAFIIYDSKYDELFVSRDRFSELKISRNFPSVTLMTRGMLIPIKVFEEIVFFDEKNFPQYGSDEDFSIRANKSEFQCFVSYNAIVLDDKELTSEGSPINNPSLYISIKSLFNKYSVNSITKSFRFYWKHGKRKWLPIFIMRFIFGFVYTQLYKYKR
jgi:GT2 family glycosyltransferase